MKKKLFSLALFAIIASNAFAQTPSWQWAKSAGGSSSDFAQSITNDANGNVYVAGSFNSVTISFGSTTLTNVGTNTSDIFLAKYDASGNVLWAKSAGRNLSDAVQSVTTDANGNILVVGYFYSSTLTFGSTILNNPYAGSSNMFLAKYDASGNVLWAKSAGGSFDDNAYSVAIDANGNILVAGYFRCATITFGSTILTNAGYNTDDIFLAKYDAFGNVLWAKSAGGSSYDGAQSITNDANGNVYVAGYFGSPSITFCSTTLANAGSNTYDMFLVKFDAFGNVLKAVSAGGSDHDMVNSIATDANGNILVAGFFKSPSLTFGSFTLTNAGHYDIFLAKYDTSGNILWAKGAGGSSTDIVSSVATDANGNILVAGYFRSSTISFGSTTLTNVGGNDVFLIKYDASGNVLWAKSAGGSSADYAQSVSTDANGNVYVAGSFHSSTITFGSDTLINTGTWSDMFIAKLNCTITGTENIETQQDITIFPNPTTGKFELRSLTSEIESIEVYNMLGEKVYAEKNSQFKNKYKKEGSATNIDLSKQAKGIYFIEIIADGKKQVKKIVLD